MRRRRATQIRRRRRARLRRGKGAHQGSRRAHRACHLPRLCQRRRHSVVRRAGRAVGTMTGGRLGAVRALCRACRGRDRRAQRSVGRGQPGGRRRRAARRAARGAVADQIAVASGSRCPSRRAARSPSATCRSTIRRGRRCKRARRRVVPCAIGRARGHRRTVRRRQDHDLRAAAALLRSATRNGVGRRRGGERRRSPRPALALRHRAAGAGAVRRYGRRQYRLWRRRGEPDRDREGGACGLRP